MALAALTHNGRFEVALAFFFARKLAPARDRRVRFPSRAMPKRKPIRHRHLCSDLVGSVPGWRHGLVFAHRAGVIELPLARCNQYARPALHNEAGGERHQDVDARAAHVRISTVWCPEERFETGGWARLNHENVGVFWVNRDASGSVRELGQGICLDSCDLERSVQLAEDEDRISRSKRQRCPK